MHLSFNSDFYNRHVARSIHIDFHGIIQSILKHDRSTTVRSLLVPRQVHTVTIEASFDVPSCCRLSTDNRAHDICCGTRCDLSRRIKRLCALVQRSPTDGPRETFGGPWRNLDIISNFFVYYTVSLYYFKQAETNITLIILL
jgi:hypothetical protein